MRRCVDFYLQSLFPQVQICTLSLLHFKTTTSCPEPLIPAVIFTRSLPALGEVGGQEMVEIKRPYSVLLAGQPVAVH